MDTRFRITVVALLGLLAAAIWTLPYWWSLVNPQSIVAEGLPGLTMDERAAYAALDNTLKRAYTALYEGDEDEGMTSQPDWAVALVQARFNQQDQPAPESNDPFEPPPGSVVVASGEFASVDAVQQARGNLMVYQNPDGTRLLRLENDFGSSRAPNMHIILTRNPDPMDERGVGVDYIDVGALHGNIGAQNYVLPPSVDFDRYPVLALYSPDYDAVLATATLR